MVGENTESDHCFITCKPVDTNEVVFTVKLR